MKRVLIIIPAYNEEENILDTYKSIIDYNKKYKTNYDVIVINDGSKDNTSKICHENNIPVIDLINNLGIGGAVQTGYKYACYSNYDIAVQFDGDGQHDVNYVKDIINPIINDNAELVIGSRFIDKKAEGFKSSFSRRVGIKIISHLIKFASHKKIYDTTSGFRACNKKIIKDFANSYPSEYPEPVTTAEIIKKGYKVEEVPVKMKERQGGESSIKAWKNVYYMLNVSLYLLIIKFRRYK
ncbi:MAG: glycosyltransferase family 2 protein [Bacilli bacterium]|nr:glycosyltransferase family 2 protein [Bacilli bacterium]